MVASCLQDKVSESIKPYKAKNLLEVCSPFHSELPQFMVGCVADLICVGSSSHGMFFHLLLSAQTRTCEQGQLWLEVMAMWLFLGRLAISQPCLPFSIARFMMEDTIPKEINKHKAQWFTGALHDLRVFSRGAPQRQRNLYILVIFWFDD